jgi:hypothetical protein
MRLHVFIHAIHLPFRSPDLELAPLMFAFAALPLSKLLCPSIRYYFYPSYVAVHKPASFE